MTLKPSSVIAIYLILLSGPGIVFSQSTPSVPSILPSTGKDFYTGESVTVACSSFGGDPAPSVKWYRNTVLVDDSFKVSQVANVNIAENRYTFTVTDNDDTATFVCRVQNSAMAAPLVGTWTLNVLAPVQGKPTIVGPTTVNVDMEYSWICSSPKAKPATSLNWRIGDTAILDGISAVQQVAPDGMIITQSTLNRTVVDSDNSKILKCEMQHKSLGPSKVIDSIVLTAINTGVPPIVTIGSQTYSGLVGNRMVLVCNVEANPALTDLQWTKDGSPIVVNSGRYTGGTTGVPSLTINSLVLTDQGSYICTATNPRGRVSSSSTQLTVQERPKVTVNQFSYQSNEGDRVQLGCSVSGVPTPDVSWLKDGSRITLTSRYAGGIASAPSLTIFTVVGSDEGNYQCSAKNSAGSDISSTISLSVTVRPTVTIPATSYTTKVGSQLVLNCIVSGTATSVTWVKDSYTLDTNVGTRKGGTVADPKLTIHPVALTDAGDYVCSASNGQLRSTGPAIKVTVEALPVVSVLRTSYNSRVGLDVELECRVSGNPTPTSVSWQKNAVEIADLSDTKKYRGGTSQNPSLTLLSASVDQSGTYYCIGKNSVGHKYSPAITVVIETTDSLTVEVSQPVYNVTTGSSVTLLCIVTAQPPVTTLTWVKDGRTIDISNNRYAGGTEINPSLTVFSVDSTDSGTYECIASNGVAEDRKSIMLSVQYATIVTVANSSYNIRLGETVTLQCSVYGEPPVTVVYWTIDGQNIDVTNSHYAGGTVANPSLTIFDVDNLDVGVYTCSAANIIGTASKLITISMGPSLTIYVRSKSYFPLFGTQATLHCEVSGSPAPNSVKWKKDGVDVIVTGRYSGSSPSVNSLTISNIQESDNGVYECTASNNLDTVSSDPINVNVAVTKRPVVTVVKTAYTESEGTDVKLLCVVTSESNLRSVSWYYNDSPLDKSSGRYVGPTLTDASLTIKSSKRLDSGKYTCKASNTAGETSGTPIQLTVEYFSTPAVTIGSRIYSVLLGQSVTMICDVDATPPASRVQWVFNGSPFTISGRFSGGSLSTPSLSISEVKESDAGDYICSATNSAGTTNSPAMQLSLRLKRRPEITVNKRTYSEAEGTTVTLQCSAFGVPPVSSVRWTFKNQNIDMKSEHYSGATASNPSLVISKIVKTDDGTYQCYATNTEGESTTSNTDITLSVLYPPIVSIPPESLSITQDNGTTLTIPCSISESNPPNPNLVWSFKSELSQNGVPINRNQSKYSSGTGDFLTIKSLALEDSGFYQCSAENGVGSSASKWATLIVIERYPPHSIRLKNVQGIKTVRKSDNVSVICEADASPKATYTWYFNEKLQQSGNNLIIPDVSAASSGNYKCKASNSLGDAFISFILDVLHPPIAIIPPGMLSLTGEKGTSLTIPCSITNSNPPNPKIVWSYKSELSQNGVPIDRNQNKYSGGADFLTIVSLALEDSGFYQCTAENSVGSSSSEWAKLTVVEKYAPTNIRLKNTPDIFKVRRSDNVSVTCEVDSNPLATYVWYFGDKLQQNGQDLIIHSVPPTSSGNYTCTAKNELGKASRSFTLDVQYPPKAEDEQRLLHSLTQVVTLDCTHTANPEVTSYEWFFGGEIMNDKKFRQLNVVLDSESKFGEYTCKATNDIGSHSMKIVLNKKPSEGQTVADAGLSSGEVAAIILAVILLLLIILIVIACLCIRGICGAFGVKKETRGRIRPQHVGVQVDMDDKKRYFETSSIVSSDVTLVSKRDVHPVLLPRYGEMPNGDYAHTNGISAGTTIISLRDPTTDQAKPHKLPPLGGGHEETEIRKLRKKKKKHRSSRHSRNEDLPVPDNQVPHVLEESDDDLVVLPGADTHLQHI